MGELANRPSVAKLSTYLLVGHTNTKYCGSTRSEIHRHHLLPPSQRVKGSEANNRFGGPSGTAGAANQIPRELSRTFRRRRRTRQRSRAWRYRRASRKAAPPRASSSWPSSNWRIASATAGASPETQSPPSRWVISYVTVTVSLLKHPAGIGVVGIMSSG